MDVLSKSDLRQLGKDLTSLFLEYKENGENGVEDAKSLLERLLRTVEEPRLEAAHRAAICDTLCGFLVQGSVSPVDGLHSLCLSGTLWKRILNIYLKRSGDAQAKPMRQVLTVLVKLLSTNADSDAATVLINGTVSRCLSLIYSYEDASCVRAAMNILEVFLNKSMITATSLVRLAMEISTESPLTDGPGGSQTPSTIHPGELGLSMVRTLPNFISMVIGWMQQVDIAPAAGRLVVSLFEASKGDSAITDSMAFAPSAGPLWLPPILEAIRERPALVDTLEYHVLPRLFRLESTDIDHVVSALPVRRVAEGGIGSVSEEELRLCLVVCKVADDLGIAMGFGDSIVVDAKSSDFSSSQYISHSLLLHVSSSVRIAALRLFIYSASSAKPLTHAVLLALKTNLPLFHGETDTRARNEFISVIKKLFARLQGVLPRLVGDKEERSKKSEKTLGCSTLPTSGPLGDHLEFVTWYISFLQDELQPVASYQRHISALKILHHLNVSGLPNWLQRYPDHYSKCVNREKLGGDFYNQSLLRLLLDLTVDPFDDVRSAAAALLQAFPAILLVPFGSTHPEAGLSAYEGRQHGQSDVIIALQRAEAMMRQTGRAAYADGVGRLCDLLYGCHTLPTASDQERDTILETLVANLGSDIHVAQNDLHQAVLSAPLYGHLIALRYIVSRPDYYAGFVSFGDEDLRQWKNIHSRLLHNCSKVWDAVKEVLCFDSPEGHVVIEPDDDGPDVGVKDTLSFCWRALKEASSLMQSMITNLAYGPPKSTANGLQYADFKALGDLAFTQLAELRHRGAFSTVSQTFAACCVRCAGSEMATIEALPRLWYQQTLACIQEKAAALTRRSAGLPAMVTGILIAYPKGDFFDRVILDLQNTANEPLELAQSLGQIRLPQVHALNCLKDIFTNARLGLATEVHVEKTLIIAVNCLEIDVWAIRNCGLMLLKALLARLVGGTGTDPRRDLGRTRRVSKLTYEKYPILADLVLHLLQRNSAGQADSQIAPAQALEKPSAQSVETVFPALEIIERVGVADSHRDIVESLLLEQLNSPVWNLRDKAAKILNSMMREEELLTEIRNALGLKCYSQNGLHGRLLCLKYMVCLERTQSVGKQPIEPIEPLCEHKLLTRPLQAPLDAEITPLLGLFDDLVISNICPITAATYLETVSHIGGLLLIDIYKTLAPRWDPYIDTPSARYVSAINEKVDGKWKEVIRMSSLQGNQLAVFMLDPLVKALASLKVIIVLLTVRHTRQLCGGRVLYELCKGGELALTAGLETLNTMLGTIPSLEIMTIDMYFGIVENACGPDSKALAMGTWTKMLASKAISTSSVDSATILGKYAWCAHGSSFETMEQEDPVIQNAALTLRGALMTYEYRLDDPFDPLFTCKMESWSQMLKIAGNERSDLSTRLAVVSSLECFKTGLRPFDLEVSTDPRLLRIYLAIYDTLLDDDDDVRSKGAAIVSWILSDPIKPESGEPLIGDVSLCPPAAVVRLLEFMCTSYSYSERLFAECISRLTGMNLVDSTKSYNASDTQGSMDNLSLYLIPVRNLLTVARKEDSSLFVEEKQNLYKDPVQEAERWAGAIHLLSPSTFQPRFASQFERWALEGLECLTKVASNELDGPLGWTSKPEVFVLGMRVLKAVEVVKTWAGQGLTTCSLEHLDVLTKKWNTSNVHPLWTNKLLAE